MKPHPQPSKQVAAYLETLELDLHEAELASESSRVGV